VLRRHYKLHFYQYLSKYWECIISNLWHIYVVCVIKIFRHIFRTVFASLVWGLSELVNSLLSMYWIYLLLSTQQTIGYNGFTTTLFRLTRVIVKLRSEPFGFSSSITYSFLFWRLLVGVKWWLALHWYEWKFKNIYHEMLVGKPFNISVSCKFHI
jgi:hypothetical protein